MVIATLRTVFRDLSVILEFLFAYEAFVPSGILEIRVMNTVKPLNHRIPISARRVLSSLRRNSDRLCAALYSARAIFASDFLAIIMSR